jgi:hypothetical protein
VIHFEVRRRDEDHCRAGTPDGGLKPGARAVVSEWES